MSAEGLLVDLRDGILVLTLSHPPLNDLTPALQAALLQAIRAQAGCRGIVLAAEGAHFSGHLPLSRDPQPLLAELCQAVEDSPAPVVAVLRGFVTGPGAELMLAARARLAEPGTRIAFAEVTLGLSPSGGSTRRLPQLIGAEAALALLTTGRTTAATEALALGLVDGIAETGAQAAALGLAEALAVGDILRRPAIDPAAWQAAVTRSRSDPALKAPAAQRIVDCVEAALLLPPENALAFEATVRAELAETPEATGLRAAARAERRALALPTVIGRLQPLSVDRIGLLGLAPDLARLAVAALSRDLGVTWVFPDPTARAAGLAAVDASIAAGERAGTLAPDRAQRMRDRMRGEEDRDALALAPLLVADRLVGGPDGWGGLPGAAQLVLGGMAGEMGLSLPPAGRVCELVLPPDILPLARATALAGVRRIGLSPVLVGHRPVAGARMADAGRTAIAWLVARGVPHRQIAAALEAFGLRPAEPVSLEAPTILRVMSPAEILHRWLAALANEGARLIGEGIARRPSDLDHLMVAGQQFPRWQGGPMHQADRRGLAELHRDLLAWGREASVWRPAPLIDRLVREGRDFAALDG